MQGLYTLGLVSGFYAPPGADSNADLTTWNTRINAGEPETSDDDAIANQICAQLLLLAAERGFWGHGCRSFITGLLSTLTGQRAATLPRTPWFR